jgi:hypothetical protein
LAWRSTKKLAATSDITPKTISACSANERSPAATATWKKRRIA